MAFGADDRIDSSTCIQVRINVCVSSGIMPTSMARLNEVVTLFVSLMLLIQFSFFKM